MKCFLKMTGLVIAGLLTAIIIYPFLHEAGHSLIAMLLGAKITEFNLIPIPYVVCEISAVDISGQMLIGLGGIIIPFILSMALNPRWFWTWLTCMILRGISVYSVILSIIAILFHINGVSWKNEDIIQVLEIFPNGTWLFLIVLCIMGTYGFMRLLKEKLFTRCIEYFDTCEKSII